MQQGTSCRSQAGQGRSASWCFTSRVCAFAICVALATAVAQAEPIAFTINSTASALDLVATGSIFSSSLSVSEQALGSKAVRYYSPTSGSLLADVSASDISFTGGSIARADTQKILGVDVPILPGNTPANYGVSLNLPLGTPISLPTIPLGIFNVTSKITGFTTNVALRNIDLDFSSGVLSHSPGFPTTFESADVDVSFAAGKADISTNLVWDIAGTPGGTFVRPAIVLAVQGLLASVPGITVTSGKSGGTDILIGFNFSQDLSLLGDLQSTPLTDGVINKVGGNYNMALPINIDVASGIDPTIAALLGLNLNLKLSGLISATGALPLIPGDANHDGYVDGADYVAWADHFLLTGQTWEDGDFTGEGVVDGADYIIWADNFAPAPSASLTVSAVPEPSSLLLGAFGLTSFVALAYRRRK